VIKRDVEKFIGINSISTIGEVVGMSGDLSLKSDIERFGGIKLDVLTFERNKKIIN